MGVVTCLLDALFSLPWPFKAGFVAVVVCLLRATQVEHRNNRIEAVADARARRRANRTRRRLAAHDRNAHAAWEARLRSERLARDGAYRSKRYIPAGTSRRRPEWAPVARRGHLRAIPAAGPQAAAYAGDQEWRIDPVTRSLAPVGGRTWTVPVAAPDRLPLTARHGWEHPSAATEELEVVLAWPRLFPAGERAPDPGAPT